MLRLLTLMLFLSFLPLLPFELRRVIESIMRIAVFNIVTVSFMNGQRHISSSSSSSSSSSTLVIHIVIVSLGTVNVLCRGLTNCQERTSAAASPSGVCCSHRRLRMPRHSSPFERPRFDPHSGLRALGWQLQAQSRDKLTDNFVLHPEIPGSTWVPRCFHFRSPAVFRAPESPMLCCGLNHQ